jgi:hypothetical protein
VSLPLWAVFRDGLVKKLKGVGRVVGGWPVYSLAVLQAA